MASTSGSSGPLSHLAATRARVQKTRQLLGLSERGVQKPQSGPPPVAPANPSPPATAPQTPVEGPATDPRQQLLQRANAHLQSLQVGAQMPPEQNQVQPVTTQQVPIEPLLQAANALNESADTQFYRLAGRPGSPREVAMFQTRMQLEHELGRPPTINELKSRISEPSIQSPSLPIAFELPQ